MTDNGSVQIEGGKLKWWSILLTCVLLYHVTVEMYSVE